MKDVIAILITAVFLACSSPAPKQDLDALLTANKAAAQKTSDLVSSVLKLAYTLPALKEVTPGAVPNKLGFEMLKPADPGKIEGSVYPTFNAIMFDEAELPTWAPKPASAATSNTNTTSGIFPLDFTYSVELALSGTYNGQPPLKDNPFFYDGVKRTFAALPALRYVLVIHSIRTAMPARTGSDTFSPGVFEGEARLFDLQTGTYLGGFAFSAHTDDTIMVNANHYDSVEIKYNLVENMGKALQSEMGLRGWI